MVIKKNRWFLMFFKTVILVLWDLNLFFSLFAFEPAKELFFSLSLMI